MRLLIVIFMLFTGANTTLSQSPLFDAVFRNNYADAEAAIDAGADVRATDQLGYGLLYHAICNDADARLVGLLIDRGADVNGVEPEFKMPMINHAAAIGDEAVVALLLRKGAKTDATDAFGGTALEEAAYNGHKRIAGMLGRAGSRTNYRGHVAAGLGDTSVLKQELATNKNTMSITPGWKSSALHFAVSGQQIESIEILLGANADPNAVNRFGNTPLHEAALHGDARIIGALRKAGAKTNLKNLAGETPADYAGDATTAVLLK